MKFRLILASITLPILALAADGPASSSGLDTAAMNKSVDPCVDFYQYACGNWIASNPLPSDRSRWGRFNELSDHNEHVLLDIIQGAAVTRAGRSSLDQKIGDAFASCMDTAAINKRGIAPIKPELDAINGMAGAPDIVAEVARLHRQGVGVLFGFGAQPDAKDSNKTIASLGQGGLSLPDRDYYLKTDPKSVEIRQHYRGAHDEDVPACRRFRRDGRRQGQDGARVRNHDRQGVGGSRCHARPQQALPHHDAQGTGGDGSRFRLGNLLQAHPCAGVRDAERHRPRLCEATGRRAAPTEHRRLESLLRVSPAARARQ